MQCTLLQSVAFVLYAYRSEISTEGTSLSRNMAPYPLLLNRREAGSKPSSVRIWSSYRKDRDEAWLYISPQTSLLKLNS